MMRVLLLGLYSARLFSTRHMSLASFASTTIRCQIPRFTSIVSRDTSLSDSHVLRCGCLRFHERLDNRQLVGDLLHHSTPSSHSHRFQPNVLLDCIQQDYTNAHMHLVHRHLSVLALQRYLAFNFFGESREIAFLPIPNQSFLSLQLFRWQDESDGDR